MLGGPIPIGASNQRTRWSGHQHCPRSSDLELLAWAWEPNRAGVAFASTRWQSSATVKMYILRSQSNWSGSCIPAFVVMASSCSAVHAEIPDHGLRLEPATPHFNAQIRATWVAPHRDASRRSGLRHPAAYKSGLTELLCHLRLDGPTATATAPATADVHRYPTWTS